MNVNLYCPHDNDENIITFSMLNTINSFSIFVFQMGAASPMPAASKLVSGYEKGLRNVCMKLECVSSYDRHAYLISCVRSPHVLLKLMAHSKFTRPVAPVIVKCNNNGETQVWHVLGVCRGKEVASIARIRGVTVCENGIETYINKELIALTGNIPSAFVAALTRNAPKMQDVEVIKLIYPAVHINDEDVVVDFK
ncbi:asb144 [Agrotis segetum nucleopolyhedrovirus B]|uniref:Asb144 n=1 Tax=Agrotis segetum nucleopolyhedrovirus B TaxID=1580580 RepID=A0A0A7KTK1_9ABAC|nr:asb144 [Agrotis segetum nucleopolyhedrovirus B]AIZ48701.1 asb144 [Agrotis segetum nucleopolyhedrovirus B]